MKNFFFTIVAASAMLASCSQDAELNEIIDNQPKAITEIGASTSAETRAVVGSKNISIVKWELYDQLGVFGTGATGVVAYTLNSTAGLTSGTFKNDASTITAIQAMMYPYQSTATWAESKLTCEIPTVQTATRGSFDKAAAIMYSIGSSTHATLNYAVNFLKVNIPLGTNNVHAITIGSDDYLSGTVKLTSTGVEEGTAKSVTLVASGGTNKCLLPGDYYIAVKKGNITSPSISYTYINSTAHTAEVKTKAGSSTLTFAEGTNVKPISVNFEKGTVTVRKAVQLWADGPYFAQETADAQPLTWYQGMNAWGSAWTLPSGDDLDNLYDRNSDRTTFQIRSIDTGGTEYIWGFKFQGNTTGYKNNSIFLPVDNCYETMGDAYYWTSDECSDHPGNAWRVELSYDKLNSFCKTWECSPCTEANYCIRVLR